MQSSMRRGNLLVQTTDFLQVKQRQLPNLSYLYSLSKEQPWFREIATPPSGSRNDSVFGRWYPYRSSPKNENEIRQHRKAAQIFLRRFRA